MVIESATATATATLSPSKARLSFPHANLTKSVSDNPISRPSAPPIRKLKSSLKISHADPPSRSKSEFFLTSPEKNVRFAIELTTVKRFDKNAEPSSISNENSPTLSPVDNYTTTDDIQLFNSDNCWFNDSSLVSNLLKNEKKFRYMNSLNNMFKLDLYDSEDEDEEDSGIDEHRNVQAGYDYTYDSITSKKVPSYHKSVVSSNASSLASQATNICDWKLHCTDLLPFKQTSPLFTKTLSASDLHDQLSSYLNGQNVKLHSLTQLDHDSSKIVGLLYVKNLSFEKYLEIKFTFNSWKDIHYVTANYNKTVNADIDEFKFIIDLNSLKYILLIKKIITMEDESNSCPLNVEICCRYDVNNETFYDNNNNKNYHLFITTFKQAKKEEGKQDTPVVVEPATIIKENSNIPPKNVSSKLISSNPSLSRFSSQSRKFSEDTDYYNTSPLKHLYHNDTTTFIKPKRLNAVLEKIDSTTPSPPPPPAGNTKNENVAKNENTASTSTTTRNNIGLPLLGSQHQSLYSGSSSYSSSSSSISSSLSFASSTNSSTNSSSSASCGFPLTELDNFDYANLYEPNDTFTTANLFNHSLNSIIPDNSTPSFFGDFGNSSNDDNNNNISNNFAASLDDSYEDKQSVITDTTMDDNIKTSNVNNSTDTLIKPSKQNGATKGNKLPTNSISSPSSSRNQTSSNLKEPANDNNELKYIDYQSLLDSHRFYSQSSSPSLQPAAFPNTVSLSEIPKTSNVLGYEDEGDDDSNQIVGELNDNAFSPHFYLNGDNKNACLSDDSLTDDHGNSHPFISTFSSSPPILSQEVDRWRL